MPGAAIIFAVRDQLESELFLQSHHFANHGVLDVLELGIRKLAFIRLFERPYERGRPDEAADVLGSEGWTRALHGGISWKWTFSGKDAVTWQTIAHAASASCRLSA